MSKDPSDPPDNPGIYVTKDACYATHLTIAERLTRLESINVVGIVASAATLIGIAYMLWRMFA